MSTEPEHDKIAEALRHTYQRMVDRASLTEPEWPPVPAVRDVGPGARSLSSGWQVAAIAAALAQNPDLADAEVTRIFTIYADDTLVDLRVQVQADAFCHIYGVTGQVRQGMLEWRGGPGLPCDP